MHYKRILNQSPIISDQIDRDELEVVLKELESIISNTDHGSIVEFGCYAGTTSLFIRRLLDTYNHAGQFHVYDSFVGLPEKTHKDISPAGEQFKAGELSVSKKDFLMNFKKAQLRPPYIHKAWFSDLAPAEVPDGISFAFLDGDYYESIMDPMKLIWPKLTPNAVIIVDDYTNEALPGAAKAVDESCVKYNLKPTSIHSLAVIHT